jgi:hypothetical protein
VGVLASKCYALLMSLLLRHTPMQAVVMEEILKATVQLAQDQYGNYGG